MRAAQRLKYQLSVNTLDALNHPSIVPLRASAVFVLAKLLRRYRPAASLRWLAHAHGILMYAARDARFSARLNRMIEAALVRESARGGLVDLFASSAIDARRAFPSIPGSAGIVLKAPTYEGDRAIERGVLVLKNSERMDAFRRLVAMDSLLSDYTLVLEPSWSGYANPKILSFAAFHDHQILVMSPCAADYGYLERLNSNLRPIT